MRRFTVAGRDITDDSPCWVVAEVGNNHQGSIQTAREMIRQAHLAGADAVKFQRRDNKVLYTPERYSAPYESEHSFGRTYGEHREALELPDSAYPDLKAYAESLGLVFFATAFDLPSVDFLDDLGVPVIKIASFDVRNLGLIQYAAATGRPLIISTGTADESDVHEAGVAAEGLGPIALLHCTSEYPAPAEHLNLLAIETLRVRYPSVVIGFSSHFSGISMPLVAYVMGARILEVHFTLNRAMKGSDHAWSLEPQGLTKLVRDLKRCRAAFGDGVKRPIPEEIPALVKQGKEPPVIA